MVVQIILIRYAVRMATESMGEDKLQEVKAFFKAVREGETEGLVDEDEQDAMEAMMSMWSKPFMPNLLNTVIFLVETSQIIAVMFVNYKGTLEGFRRSVQHNPSTQPMTFVIDSFVLFSLFLRLFVALFPGRPWMKGLLENHFLFLSVFLCIAFVAFCAWEMNPTFNTMMHLAPFPDDEFRISVIGLCLASVFGTFVIDRICVILFAPTVGKAMLVEASKTTLWDTLPVFKTMGKVILGLGVVGSGNPLIWIGCAYYYYRTRQAAKAALLKPEQ
jgi:cation-transporting ATPase 13A1